MKKAQILLMALAAILFIACEKPQEVVKPITYPTTGGTSGQGGSEDNGGSTTETTAHVEFSYETKAPYGVVIKDKSAGYSVKYEFGDGKSKTCAPGETIEYRYAGAGTYKIKGTASGSSSSKDDYTVSVTISKPKIYIAGVRYHKIDVDGEHYKAVLKDDDFFTTTWLKTDYTKDVLNNSRLPHDFTLYNPVLMDGLADDSYYTLYIYHAADKSKDGTQCLKQTIYTTKFEECLETIRVKNNSGNTEVELLMQYK